MQGHKKPARNYLGKQKTVKNIPIKWKSGPKAPATELAYITKAEKDLILKKDLHGSLKHGPNTGPDGIMSLDTQGDYTQDRSPSGPQGGGGNNRGDSERAVRAEAHMREILTGQKNIGQTSAVSERTRRGAVPEWVETPAGRKYVGSAYKDTGRRGLLSRVLGGTNKYGYGSTYGTGSGRIFDRQSSIKFNPVTGRYESEEENVGEIKPGYGGRILGGLASMLTGIPLVGGLIGNQIDKYKPKSYWDKKDPSEQRTLNALNITPYNEQKLTAPNVPMATTDRWTTPASANKGIPYTAAFTGGNTYPVQSNFADNMATYTGGIEQGNTIDNDEQMFIDDKIFNQRFP